MRFLQVINCLQFRFKISSEKIFGTLEAKYLEQCANNLKTAILALEATSPESVDAYIQTVNEEFRNISGDSHLSSAVSAIFVACSKEFWSKYEMNVKLGGDAEQVLGNCRDLPSQLNPKTTKII